MAFGFLGSLANIPVLSKVSRARGYSSHGLM